MFLADNETEGLSSIFIDVTALPDTWYGTIQIIFITLVYGYILFNASYMISEGSELLLLFPAISGIVGSIILPILGAVPDGMIVLFSGLGDNAQEELSVGVGALAGSTIMLLTVPWFLSIFAGRVDLDDENKLANYKIKSSQKTHYLKPINKQGVSPSPIVKRTAKLIAITAVAYLIIQIPAFASHCYLETDKNRCNQPVEKWFSLVGLIYCVLNFIYYLYRQFKENNDAIQLKQEQLMVKYIEKSFVSLKGLFAQLQTHANDGTEPLLQHHDSDMQIKNVVAHIFHKFDTDNNKLISLDEFTEIFKALHENPDEDIVKQIFTDIDKDKSGFVNEAELLDFFVKYAYNEVATQSHVNVHEHIEHENEQEDEEVEMPEDLLSLSPEQQRRRLLMRSFFLMGVGTALVIIFSDPMVGCLNEVANRIGIPAFYIAFLLAPLASNASEIIASYNYATKKTQNTITISFSSLQGAACLNNTFCLAVFFAIIFFRNLTWEFTAEVIAILIVEILMILYSLKSTNTVVDGIIVILLLPLSLGIVIVLEAIGLN